MNKELMEALDILEKEKNISKEVIEKDTGVKSYLIEKTSSKEIKLKVMGIIAESEIKSICGKFSLKDLMFFPTIKQTDIISNK